MKIRTLVCAVAGIATLVALASSSHGGDLERYCVGTQATEVTTRWATSTNLPWSVCTGPNAQHIAPQLPSIACSYALTNDEFAHPGMQSIRRAMLAWQNAATAMNGPFGTPGTVSVSFVAAHGNQAVPSPGVPVPLTLLTQPPDGQNLITFWEPATSFLRYGGTFVLALAAVLPNFPSGQIIECDIAAQALTMDPAAPGQPFWAWVENNDLYGETLVATRLASATTTSWFPTLGYVDMQGVLTHELGHFVGLGHAVIDSDYADTLSTMPTMFPFADIQTFEQSVFSNFSGGVSCTDTQYPSKGVATAGGGSYGVDLRTLELDDVRALLAGYPNAMLTPGLGTIQGTVTSAGSPAVLGANVVAINTTDPTIRASTFVYNDGLYRLTMLPPGNYYLYAEPVDQSPPGVATWSYYLPGGSVPSYIDLQPPPGFGFVPCTANEFFTTEFFDAAEATVETTPMAVTPLAVNAGGTVVANFLVDSVLNTLDLEVLWPGLNPIRRTPRGAVIGPNSTTYPLIDVRVSGTPGRRVVLVFDTKPSPVVVGNQLWMAQGGSDPAMPIPPVGTIGANGTYTFQFQLTPAMAQRNIFMQAAVGVNNNLRLSNFANVIVGTH
jgi:hypothetical protein